MEDLAGGDFLEINIRMHFPDDPSVLSDRVAGVYEKLIKSYIEKQPMSASDKMKLWETVKEEVKKQADVEKAAL